MERSSVYSEREQASFLKVQAFTRPTIAVQAIKRRPRRKRLQAMVGRKKLGPRTNPRRPNPLLRRRLKAAVLAEERPRRVRGELTTCSQCGVGNEHGGSFCYLCGHSLLRFAPADGPWLFPEGSIARADTPRPAICGVLAVSTPIGKPIRQKSSSGRVQGQSAWRYGFVLFLQFAVLGLVAALLVEVCRPPDHLPPGVDSGD